jgi:hypothetical protein
MPEDAAEWMARFAAAKLDRLRAGNERTLEQLRKTCKQLALSEKALRLPVPKVWHPERPDRGSTSESTDNAATAP